MSTTSRRSLAPQETISLSPGDPLRDLFEACKHGDVSRVRSLVTTQNVNARDTAGRKSSPLHFAAGRDNKQLYCSNNRLPLTVSWQHITIMICTLIMRWVILKSRWPFTLNWNIHVLITTLDSKNCFRNECCTECTQSQIFYISFNISSLSQYLILASIMNVFVHMRLEMRDQLMQI